MPPSPPSAASSRPFDEVLAELRAIVDRLEGGNLSLEESLTAFEEGVRLARSGTQILDDAEARVEILLRDQSGERIAPFGAAPEGKSDGKADGSGR